MYSSAAAVFIILSFLIRLTFIKPFSPRMLPLKTIRLTSTSSSSSVLVLQAKNNMTNKKKNSDIDPVKTSSDGGVEPKYLVALGVLILGTLLNKQYMHGGIF